MTTLDVNIVSLRSGRDGKLARMVVAKGARAFRGVPAEVRAQERRSRLLEAGFSLFGARGYHSVTVRELCAEAKLTERYFYESFGNMEELFAEVLAKVHAELKQATLVALTRAERTPEGLAYAAVHAFFNFVHEDKRRGRVVAVDALHLGDRITERAKTATQGYVVLMREFIRMLFPAVEAQTGLRADYIAQGLVGVNTFMFWHWSGLSFSTPLHEVIHNAMTFYRAMIAHVAVMRSSAHAVEQVAVPEVRATRTDSGRAKGKKSRRTIEGKAAQAEPPRRRRLAPTRTPR